MNLYDFLIIYLACGAPLGVYYFLQNRKTPKFENLWLKTFINFIFWPPFAYRILRENKISQNFLNRVFGNKSSLDADAEKNIYEAQRRLEQIFFESRPKISLYEFRENVERYAGLTLAGQFENKKNQTERAEFEIFRIAGNKNAKIAAACLERRNRERLSFHQTQARHDFLNVLAKLSDFQSDGFEKLKAAATRFATLLNDAEAQTAIEKMFDGQTQTENVSSVKNAETELWKSETRKPLLTRPISARLKAMSATTGLRSKD